MTDTETTLQKFKQEHYALQKEHQHSIKEMETLRKELKSMKEENERLKQKLPETQREALTQDIWDKIRQSVRSNDVDTIKQLINQKKLDMMDKDPRSKQTVLLIAAKAGCYDIVQLCINLDATLDEVDKDGRSALDLARDGAWTHVERLLLFSKMNANAGDSILHSANTINKQKGIIQNLLNQLNLYVKRKQIFKDTVIDLMIGIIENKLAFSDDLLHLAWEFSCGSSVDLNKQSDKRSSTQITNPLSTKLWKSIQKTCKDVVENGTKRDWFWLKSFIVPSTIWYKNISLFKAAPNMENIQEEKAKDDESAQSTNDNTHFLYYELLKLVDDESETDLNALEADLKKSNKEDWDKLINWDLELNNQEIVRQDRVPNGIIPQYTFDELTQSSATDTKFNVHSHYDLNQYLPQLILLSHIIDDEFQQSVCKMMNIDKDTHCAQIEVDHDDEKRSINGGEVRYMRGPVKLMERARAKAENDYAQEAYPTSALVLDLNRCALAFDDIATLLIGLDRFVNKVRYYQSGNIIGVMRVKNGFIEYNKKTQYADIKLNVLIKGARSNIVGEVQFLLQRMLNFKKKAHNLYSIQRQAEYMESSVKQILPSLTDDKKELFVAGNGGDIKALLRLMVFNNKTDQDLMQIDKESQESILTNICALGHAKALSFLANTSVVRRDKFIETLLSANRYNSTPVEAGVVHKSLPLAQILFSIPELVSVYQTDNRQLYRLLVMLYRTSLYGSFDRRVAQHVMDKLKLSKEKLNEIIHYQYTKDVYKEARFAERYIGHMIPCIVSLTRDIETIRQFSNALGENVFMEYIMNEVDIYNITTFEWCMIHNGTKRSKSGSMEVIQYFLSNSIVVDILKQNMYRIFRVLHWIFSAFRPDTFPIIMTTLDLDKNDLLLKVLQFEDKTVTESSLTERPKKKAKKTKRVAYSEKLVALLLRKNHIDICQKVVDIIGAKEFVHLLFESDSLNTNCWEWAIMQASIETIEWILNIASVKEYILKEKNILFRTIFWTLCRYREDVFEFIKKELQITDNILADLVSYRPTKPPKGKFHVKAKEYWDKGLISIACTSYDVVIVQQLADSLDPIVFAKEVFADNNKRQNILEFLITKHKFEIVNYLIKLEEIQNVLNNSDESLFRLIYWMLYRYDVKIFDLIATVMQFDAQTFIKLVNFKHSSKKDGNDDDEKMENEEDTNVYYQYERCDLVQASVNCAVNSMERLLSYIDSDLFVATLMDGNPNEFNVNAIESASRDMEILKFIFSLNGMCDRLQKDEMRRYRLVCYSGRHSNDECFDYILNQLQINDDVLSKLVEFKYPKQQFDAQQFNKSERLATYHDKSLLLWMAMSLNERVLRILRVIPMEQRLTYLLQKDANQMTPFSFVVDSNRLDLAKDILSLLDKAEDKNKLVASTAEKVTNEKLKQELFSILNS